MSDHTRVNQQSQEIPYGYCHCGCGQKTRIARRTNRPQQEIKGEPRQFVRGHNGRRVPHAPEGFKICTRCRETKPISKFYQYGSGPDAGKYRPYCAKCFQETWDERYADPTRREKLTKRARAYREANSSAVKEAKRKTERKYPEKKSAQDAVRHRVAAGKFPPAYTMVCEICKENQAAHWHHHRGYDKPHRFDVIAVCVECHTAEHRMEL
jgi:hypothetical protein